MPTFDGAALDQDWGCGYGFAISDGNETVRLVIHTEDWEAARGGTLRAEAILDAANGLSLAFRHPSSGAWVPRNAEIVGA
ncbi:hypothetical protein BH23ACT9_BH23ACT9_08020 [soil metagenome]